MGFPQERVSQYSAAQSRFPQARIRELEPFCEKLAANTLTGSIALELASGTGFLTRAIAQMGYAVDTVDPMFPRNSASRDHFQTDLSLGLGAIERPPAGYRAILSLAALHHIAMDAGSLQDKLVRDITRVAAPGATLIFQDVPRAECVSGSSMACGAAAMTAHFFTEIVDKFSVPQHRGVYLDFASVGKQFTQYSWRIRDVFWHYCPWQFQTHNDLVTFVSQLFSLELVGIDEWSRLLQPQIRETAQGVELIWALGCLVMELPATYP